MTRGYLVSFRGHEVTDDEGRPVRLDTDGRMAVDGPVAEHDTARLWPYDDRYIRARMIRLARRAVWP